MKTAAASAPAETAVQPPATPSAPTMRDHLIKLISERSTSETRLKERAVRLLGAINFSDKEFDETLKALLKEGTFEKSDHEPPNIRVVKDTFASENAEVVYYRFLDTGKTTVFLDDLKPIAEAVLIEGGEAKPDPRSINGLALGVFRRFAPKVETISYNVTKNIRKQAEAMRAELLKARGYDPASPLRVEEAPKGETPAKGEESATKDAA
jgi:hypothetical protein